ncbi:ABC transporter permease [Inconstantimicrobium mannanitabidum]|uniref:Uncharacterized protein n=1 Tax=Inconstantimicrobium mannanitabidum TaxID=1604901 RepID=A0ACB5RJE7_9CLOT|nr:ABC transporter permease [Clostridium sp. TW13]GKX68920.1 hypothetical protein rsdtw13_41780 [Clostridium sp. TW13]
MKRLIKKSVFLIIVFVSISFFTSYETYMIEYGVKQQVAKNILLSKSSKEFFIDYKEDEVKKDNSLLSLQGDYVLLKKDIGDFSGKGIYFKGALKNKPKLLSGRFFNESDFNAGKKVAVVQKQFADRLIEKDGKKYYYTNNINYEVIGIIDDDKKEISDDTSAYINLDSLLQKDSFYLKGDYYIDAKENTDKLFTSLKQLYSSKNVDVQEKQPLQTPLSKLLSDQSFRTDTLIKIMIIFILNTVCVTEYWIKSRKNEIGIRRAVGSTKLKISLSIIKELILVSIGSFILGYLIYIIVTYIKEGYIHYYATSVMLSFAISMISALITSIVPIYKANKMEPSEIMR